MREADSGDLLLVGSGDIESMNRIMERWKRGVYGIYERCMEPSAASEATTETFVRLYRSSSKFDPDFPFPIWLHAIVAGILLARPALRMSPLSVARLRDSMAARASHLRAAIAALPPRERTAFLLTRVGRLTIKDTATILKTRENEVKKLLVRAMETLSETLSELLHEPDLVMGTTSRGVIRT